MLLQTTTMKCKCKNSKNWRKCIRWWTQVHKRLRKRTLLKENEKGPYSIPKYQNTKVEVNLKGVNLKINLKITPEVTANMKTSFEKKIVFWIRAIYVKLWSRFLRCHLYIPWPITGKEYDQIRSHRFSKNYNLRYFLYTLICTYK